MASIKISELRPAGSELFQDSESFLNELSEREISGIEGGGVIIFSGNGINEASFVKTAGKSIFISDGAGNTNKVGC